MNGKNRKDLFAFSIGTSIHVRSCHKSMCACADVTVSYSIVPCNTSTSTRITTAVGQCNNKAYGLKKHRNSFSSRKHNNHFLHTHSSNEANYCYSAFDCFVLHLRAQRTQKLNLTKYQYHLMFLVTLARI